MVGNPPRAGAKTMRRTQVTFAQLDKVLRSLGFTCRAVQHGPPGHVYQHEQTGAMILLPAFRDTDKLYEHHLAAARLELENFGLADASVFAAKLQKAG
jgi:hypothetical protein